MIVNPQQQLFDPFLLLPTSNLDILPSAIVLLVPRVSPFFCEINCLVNKLKASSTFSAVLAEASMNDKPNEPANSLIFKRL